VRNSPPNLSASHWDNERDLVMKGFMIMDINYGPSAHSLLLEEEIDDIENGNLVGHRLEFYAPRDNDHVIKLCIRRLRTLFPLE
jgi:hypothetical protein